MDKKEAIDSLKQALTEIPHFRRLYPENREVTQWYNKVRNILQEVFGRSSWEYNRFVGSTQLFMPPSEAERQEAYNSYLDYKEIALNLIINKCESRYKKLWHESKDFIATIIAKLVAEKTK